MTYEIIYRFWGIPETRRITAIGKTERDKIWNELENNPSITYIAYNQILKDGTIKPKKSLYIGIK